jgi:hypothetical protein
MIPWVKAIPLRFAGGAGLSPTRFWYWLTSAMVSVLRNAAPWIASAEVIEV